MTSPRASFELVRLPNGTHSVYSADYSEKMHPGLGPQAEADLLYVQQLDLPSRMRTGTGDFVIWDIGLGAAANAIATLRATKDIPRPLRLVSFDNTAAPLAFAVANATTLGYLEGYQTPTEHLLDSRCSRFQNGLSSVSWEFHLADFPALLAAGRHALPPPDAILFDAFSPAKNPAMWTLPVFENLFRALDPGRPCNLTTYSRSTMFRVTLLLAGFFVGAGVATGMKEETTVAANHIDLINQPLDHRWLERAQRSDSAEPLSEPVYRRARLSQTVLDKLSRHPQFHR